MESIPQKMVWKLAGRPAVTSPETINSADLDRQVERDRLRIVEVGRIAGCSAISMRALKPSENQF